MTWRVQFDWFVDFCGLERDGEVLRAFFSTARLKLSAHLSELQDEEAPVSAYVPCTVSHSLVPRPSRGSGNETMSLCWHLKMIAEKHLKCMCEVADYV